MRMPRLGIVGGATERRSLADTRSRPRSVPNMISTRSGSVLPSSGQFLFRGCLPGELHPPGLRQVHSPSTTPWMGMTCQPRWAATRASS